MTGNGGVPDAGSAPARTARLVVVDRPETRAAGGVTPPDKARRLLDDQWHDALDLVFSRLGQS